MKIERRRAMTLRQTTKTTSGDLSGIAVPYNEASHPIPGGGRSFREVMSPGALEFSDDTVLLLQHDPSGIPLARVGAGTLRFNETDAGLEFSATLPANRQDLREALERGDLDGSVSVGMIVEEDEWTHGKEYSMRRVTAGRLVELSIVAAGAYEGASATYQEASDG